MSLSKSHATLDYLDTSMSVSWRREYIPSPEKKKNKYKQIKTKKKKPNSIKNLKTKTDKCIERDGLKLIIKW